MCDQKSYNNIPRPRVSHLDACLTQGLASAPPLQIILLSASASDFTSAGNDVKQLTSEVKIQSVILRNVIIPSGIYEADTITLGGDITITPPNAAPSESTIMYGGRGGRSQNSLPQPPQPTGAPPYITDLTRIGGGGFSGDGIKGGGVLVLKCKNLIVDSISLSNTKITARGDNARDNTGGGGGGGAVVIVLTGTSVFDLAPSLNQVKNITYDLSSGSGDAIASNGEVGHAYTFITFFDRIDRLV